METRSFRVDGMTCMGCVNTVKRLVSALPGVGRVEVSLDAHRAEVEFDAAKLAPARIVEVLGGAGYDVTPAPN